MTVAEKNRTIYSSVPVQIFIINSIKQPMLDGVEVIFNPDASKITKLRAANQLWKAFQAMSKLPEPTVENTWHPNSHILIGLRDWLFERCFLSEKRNGFIRRLFNFVIILYELDPPWRWVIDSLKDEAFKKKWKLRGYQDTWIDKYTWWRDK